MMANVWVVIYCDGYKLTDCAEQPELVGVYSTHQIASEAIETRAKKNGQELDYGVSDMGVISVVDTVKSLDEYAPSWYGIEEVGMNGVFILR